MAKVLLVEDEETIQRVNALALKMAGLDVVTANSGAEALVRVEEDHFDAIILDMLMIGMSGLDFLKSYDVKTKSPQTKIIVVSNMDNPSIEEKAKSLGVSDYLRKSDYEPQQLASYILEHITNKDSTTITPTTPPVA